MDHSLFLLSPDKISWNEIRAFLDQELEETVVLEYTQVLSPNDFEGVLECISAMANTEGGIIIVGVGENKDPKKPNRPGNIVGMEPKWVDALKNKCRSSLQPTWVPEMIPVGIPPTQDKIVLLIRINPERCPRPLVKRQDGVRVRVDNSNQLADLYRLQQLFGEKTHDFAIGPSNLGPSFSPDLFLTLDVPYDVLIRCCLIGNGSSSSGFNSTVKEHVRNFLSQPGCPIEKLMSKYVYEVQWEYSRPAASNYLTLVSKRPLQPSHLPGMAFQNIEINARVHISQPELHRTGILILDLWIKRLSGQEAQAPSWYPLSMDTFYELVVTGLATITDPGLNEQLAEVSSLWPTQLQTYVYAQSNPWLNLANWSCIESLRPSYSFQSQVEFSESERLTNLSRMVKEGISMLLANHGCINYEKSIQSLQPPAFL